MVTLPDGEYDCIVVDAEVHEEDGVRIDLTVTRGVHKGEMLSLRATAFARDPVELLGLPATLNVRGGQPQLSW